MPQAYTLYNIHVYARCTCMYMFRAELKPEANHDNDCNSGYLGIRINIIGQIKLLLFKHINICINLFVHSSLTMHPVNVSVCLSVFLSDCDQFSNTGQKCAKLFNSDFRGKNTLDTFDASGARLMGDLRNDTRLVSSGQTGHICKWCSGPAWGPEASIRKALAGQRRQNNYIIIIYKLDHLSDSWSLENLSVIHVMDSTQLSM